MEASEVASKEEFSEVMEFEFKTFFASAGARSSDKEGDRARSPSLLSSPVDLIEQAFLNFTLRPTRVLYVFSAGML